MRFGYWLPVFGGWLRNVENEDMEASWNTRNDWRSEAKRSDSTSPSLPN